MANIPLKTIPGTIDISDRLSDFKTAEQVVWTGNNWKEKAAFTPSYGDKNFFGYDPSSTITYQKDMYNSSESTGLAIYCSAGNEHKCNYELHGDSRWMPASIFNGIGFEVKQADGNKHSIYLKYYALSFAHRDSSAHAVWGVDTGARDPSASHRFINIKSSDSVVSQIRSWGPEWLFQGIILHVWNNGGTGSSNSNMYVYNMKVGSKMSTIGGAYRYLPAGKRTYPQRDPRRGNSGLMNFNNLFTE